MSGHTQQLTIPPTNVAVPFTKALLGTAILAQIASRRFPLLAVTLSAEERARMVECERLLSEALAALLGKDTAGLSASAVG